MPCRGIGVLRPLGRDPPGRHGSTTPAIPGISLPAGIRGAAFSGVDIAALLRRARQDANLTKVELAADEITEIAGRHKAVNVRVFGSYLRGTDTEHSGVDIVSSDGEFARRTQRSIGGDSTDNGTFSASTTR